MARRSRRREKPPFKQLPWRQVVNRYPPIEPLDEEQIEQIHDASMQVIEELGMVFLDEDACESLRKAGADTDKDTQLVRMDRDMVLQHVAKAPAEFTLYARNPAHNLRIGGNVINFSAVGSPPNCSDMDHGRRPGNFEDFRNLVRLVQSLNIVHMIGGHPVEPIDLPVETRHLDSVRVFVTDCDKVFSAYALGRERISDAIDMACIVRGKTRDKIKSEPSFHTVINTNSPLKLDGPMLRGLKEAAEWGQCIVITPFTLAGAMSPVTLAGALTQQNAEALMAIAYTQIVAPGTPTIYGGFTSNVDMKTGAPAFGTPEYTRAELIGGQLARRYKLPYRSSNVNASNCVDSQATYESMMSIWGAVMGGCHMMKHAVGWLEGGLCASFEKIIVDAEMLQTMAEFLEPIGVDEASIGIDAMRDVGPGGHFFGTAHTLDRYETAFYEPMLSDWRNFETWEEAGSVTAERRANKIFKAVLAEYQPPPMEATVREELDAFVEQRRREITTIAAA